MRRLLLSLAALGAALPGALHAQPAGLEEIVVTASFRDTELARLPVSVTVLDREQLRETTQQHFEEAIRQVPNLNLSGEGSRARYFQLRGVGELEQYEGSPNPSIGFIVDDIDFSGLGSIGTLFDIDRDPIMHPDVMCDPRLDAELWTSTERGKSNSFWTFQPSTGGLFLVPADGFATGAFYEILPAGNPFPTSYTWYTSVAKTDRIVELLVTRGGMQNPITEIWNMYDTDGSTIVATVTDSITYSGPFEVSRTRAIS